MCNCHCTQHPSHEFVDQKFSYEAEWDGRNCRVSSCTSPDKRWAGRGMKFHDKDLSVGAYLQFAAAALVDIFSLQQQHNPVFHYLILADGLLPLVAVNVKSHQLWRSHWIAMNETIYSCFPRSFPHHFMGGNVTPCSKGFRKAKRASFNSI